MPDWSPNPIFDSFATVWTLAALLAAITALGTVVSMLRGRVPRSRCLMLGGLRLGVILVLLLAMLQLVRSTTETEKQSATLIVLLDRSRSMLIKDAFAGKSRWDSLNAALDESREVLGEMAETLEIVIYEFDAELQPVDFDAGKFQLSKSPDGEQTAIGAALQDALRDHTGKRIAGVVLVTDGSQRALDDRNVPPEQPARRMADLDYPLFTVPLGQPRGKGQARDVAVDPNLQLPRNVFVKNQLPVRGEVLIQGYGKQEILVELLFESADGEMKVVKSTTVTGSDSNEPVAVELAYVPQEPGEYKVTLRAAEQDGELVKTNNQRSTFVTVREGGLNVLYLEGAHPNEQRFLRASLDASPDIQVDYKFISSRTREVWPLKLAELFKPEKYDVYILGDVDSSALEEVDQQALVKRVSKDGAGLLMIGGLHTFGPGGYGLSPLAQIMPVNMGGRLVRQRFDEPVRPDMHVVGDVPIRLAGRRLRPHPATRLAEDPEKNRQLWKQLPPLQGVNKFEGVRNGAQVLLESPKKDPLLVTQKFEAGTTMAFAGDSTWHWCMEGPGEEGFGPQHRRFWRQLVLYLVGSEEDNQGSVWIKLDSRELAQGRPARITAGAKSTEGDPISDVQLKATVTLPDGSTRDAPLGRKGLDVTGPFRQTIAPGDYTVEVVATRGGDKYGSAKARFLVFAQDLELDNAAASPTKLSSLAAKTKDAGGRSVSPEEIPALLAEIRDQPLEEVERHLHERLGDHWWDAGPMFLMVVALLGVEWFLRKKWGMV